MGAIDNNGIWKYDMSDKVNGWPAWMNLATNSVSNVIKDLRPKIVYTASSQSDANAKVSALKSSGIAPTTTAPFFFWRTDTKSLYVYDNSTWTSVNDTNNSAQSLGPLTTVANGRLTIQTTPGKVIQGGSNASWNITYDNAYSTPPLVLTGWTSGSVQFRGSITVYNQTTTGCSIRVDNEGTQAGSVSPWAMIVRV